MKAHKKSEIQKKEKLEKQLALAPSHVTRAKLAALVEEVSIIIIVIIIIKFFY